VALITMKGESEGLPYRNPGEIEHEIPEPYRGRVVVFRPRHRPQISFVERRWPALRAMMELGRLRAREVLLGEVHPETEARAEGTALTLLAARILLRRQSRRPRR
jgi:hypothetical protein